MTSVMTLDQLAAFDCLDHELLLKKLEKYNVGMEAREWMKNYLSYRTQYVVLGRSKSRMVKQTAGVPQGSVIGPLLYAVYMNDMTEVIKRPECEGQEHLDRTTLWGTQCKLCGHLTQYADDTTFTTGSRTRQDNQQNLERNLKELSLYLQDNSLVINQSKTSLTEVMICQKRGKTPGQPPTLLVETATGEVKTVKDRQHTRILGGNVQCNMSWQAHLETGLKALLPQVRRQLGHLRHQGRLIPKASRRNLVQGLIVSRLSYLLPLWGGATESYLRRAQVVLNTAARWSTGLGKRTRIQTLMEAAGLMSIKEQTKISTAVLTWKIVHLSKPMRLKEKMTVTQDFMIETTVPRLEFSTNCFRWRATQQWNDMSSEMRQEQSLIAFKRQYRRKVLDERCQGTLEPD